MGAGTGDRFTVFLPIPEIRVRECDKIPRIFLTVAIGQVNSVIVYVTVKVSIAFANRGRPLEGCYDRHPPIGYSS
jgi:hypothetical protein